MSSDFAKSFPLKILIVEDNVINQKVAVRILNQFGYKPDMANNGKEGVDAVLKQDYQLILMDIQMPIMDGIEATREIKRIIPPEQQPYIVALTANALEGDRERFLAAGMDDYLSKPLKLDSLKQIFKSLCKLE
jgi:CheY-like chemotaxis protein